MLLLLLFTFSLHLIWYRYSRLSYGLVLPSRSRMLGRRSSTTPAVDERLPFPAIAASSESYSFHAPEGAYELAYEVTPPPPSSATPMVPGISNVAVVAAAQQAQQEWPSCLATAVIRFPPSQSTGSGGILGLGGNQRSARSREPSAVESPQTSSAADESSSACSYDNANALPGASAASLQYANSTKRKPLISLPSSVGISSLSSGPSNAQQAPPASKPKSAFRGTSSTFVKAYEGLPFSGRADKLWAGQEYRDVSLAIFTAGKVIIIADISPRAKSRVRCSIRMFYGLI